MRLIRTEDAAGHVLCHDMTQIIPGVTKDARFRKGHVVTEDSGIAFDWERTSVCLGEDRWNAS